jgi:hypothetical protein
MNMGIGDAVDLGWKMAARVVGWGGDELLASYELERRKVHERTIAEALHNFGATSNQLVRPALEEPGLIGEATRREVADIIQASKLREFKTLGIVLGTRYENSPIIVADGSDPPTDHFMLYVPSAHPGCLAPHLWLSDGSSLYDHFGDGFTLLVTDGEPEAADELVAAAAKRKVPVKVLALAQPIWRSVCPYSPRSARRMARRHFSRRQRSPYRPRDRFGPQGDTCADLGSCNIPTMSRGFGTWLEVVAD